MDFLDYFALHGSNHPYKRGYSSIISSVPQFPKKKIQPTNGSYFHQPTGPINQPMGPILTARIIDAHAVAVKTAVIRA